MGEKTAHEVEQAIEIRGLRAENVRLRKLRAEDRKFSDQRAERLELAIAVAEGGDSEHVEERIRELQKTIAEDGAVIDRIMIFLRKRDEGGPE